MPVRHGIFFRSSIQEKNDGISPSVTGYRWQAVDEQTIIHDPIFAVKDRRVKSRTRLADGHACYGFFDSMGGVAYYMWITITYDATRAVPWELNTQLIIKPKAGYFWDCFTAPQHRRRGLYRVALHKAKELAVAKGAQKSYICSLKENVPSITAIRSAGFYDIFEFTVGRIGPVVFCKRSGGGVSVRFGIPRFAILD